MAEGHAPGGSMFERVVIFLGGVLLFFPGLISDFIGLLFLMPFVRRFLINKSMQGMKTKTYYRYQQGEQVFEGEWEEKQPEKPQNLTHDESGKK